MNNDFYGKFDDDKRSAKSSIILPFVSGILGASLVIGTCFGVPSIKTKLISTNGSIKETSTNISSTPNTTAQVSLSNFSDTSIYAAKKALPSIAKISISYNVTFWGRTSEAEASGSGVVISEDGYILTNNHVVSSSDSNSFYQVSQATSIKVSLGDSSETYDAKIIGTDEFTDLAVIKIDATGLTAAEFGDSSNLQIGEFVLAIGNPLGLDISVTSGIISALNREITSEDGTAYKVIQTDSAINSGNSGGALVNSQGQVIGINTLKLSGTGIEGVGFAIPINDTIDIANQLINNGKVLRPYIGISGSDLSESIAKRYNLPVGIYVEKLDENSGAYDSGLKIGDVITAINNEEVKNMNELNEVKNKLSIGDTVTLKVYRSGEYLDINIKLVETP